MMISEVLGRNISFSEEEVRVFSCEDRIKSLVHMAVHGKIEYHRDLAAKQILEMYKRGDKSVTIEHVVQVDNYANDPEVAKEAHQLIRDSMQPPH
jgi:hypothetical protein